MIFWNIMNQALINDYDIQRKLWVALIGKIY